MKDKSNIKASFFGKRVLILLTTVMLALALCVTCILVFDGDKAVKVPVDEVTDGEVSTSATAYTNRASGSLVGVVNNGDVLNITVTGQNVRNYTLPQGTYRFDLYGGQGGGCGNDNGGKGGRMYVTYNVTASSQLFYFSVGGKGTNATSSIDGGYDSTHYAGGVNGGGRGSGRGGPGGGGGTDIRTGGSGTSNRVVVAAGGGGGSSGNTAYTQSFSSSGVLYQGASGCSSRHSSRYSNDEGGGGGGYYGGAVRHGDDPRGSYSGNNYAASGYSVSTNALGQNAGNGKIIITVVSVNTAPTTKNYTYNNTSTTASVNTYRGSGKAINIGVTTIASDASGQTLYYTTGTGTDAAPSGSNNYLYTNSTGSTLATTYIDWTWVNSTTLRITNIKRYPSGGKLTLYARVRDNYGSSASMRASALIPFYITVNNHGITIKNETNTPTRYQNKGTAPNTYEYRLGLSNTTIQTTDFIADTNAVYGTRTGIRTVFVPQPLTTGHPGFTISAADLFATADSGYDIVGIKSVASSSYTAYYTITYNSGVAGIYSSITIKPTNARPTSAIFVTVQITAQEYEKATNTALSSTNTSLYLTFKIANTRPYFASNTLWNSGNTAEPYIELNVGQSIDLSITSFLYDPDGTTPTFVTSGAANSFIKVPTNEYICVTRDNSVIGLKSGTNYNKGKTVPTTWQSGEGNTATGFSAATLAANGSAAASTACVTYSYPNNKTLRLTGRAATQYQYGAAGRKGDLYILVRVSDPGESTDNGIWYPVAVKVKNSAPKEPSTTASFDLSFTAASGEGAPVGNPIYLTPVSYTDSNGVLRGVGTIDSNTVEQAEQQVSPFVTDVDVFSYAASDQYKAKLNDIITINGTTVAAALALNNTQQFFTVELCDLYAKKEVFDNYLKLNRSSDNLSGDGRIVKHSDAVYKFKGLKVTPLRSTGDYYYEIGVKTVDSLGGTNDNVRVFFKVANKAVNARSADSTNYPFNIGSSHGAIVTTTTDYDINYTIEKSDVIYITPYDLAYDFDTQYGSLNNIVNGSFNFNTNPYDSGFAQAVSAINATYGVKRLASVGSSSVQAQNANVTVQQLLFGGEDAFKSAAAQYTAYFNAEMVNTVTAADGNNYNVPAIKITANGRTSANLPVLRLTVTDGYSSVTVNVAITVRNAAPKLKPAGGSLHSVIAGTPRAGSGLGNSRDFDIGTYVEDIDNDTPSFVAGTVRVVAKIADEEATDGYIYTSLLTAQFGKADDLTTAAYNLEDYIYAVLTKDNYGNDIIRITGLSSTQLFPVPIYLEFRVNDGYRADPQQPTMRIPVEVVNSDPEFLTSDLTERENGGYGWFVKVENMPEKALPRYIVNCPELYNSSTAISAAPSNKMLLFADADAKQRVLLNPAGGLPTGQTDADTIAKLAQVYTGGEISEDTFGFANYQNAAVLYTPTYESADKNTLDISVIFYKEDNGSIRALAPTEGTSDMWAIMIVDRTNTNDNGKATQISIAVADNHHKADIYSQGAAAGKGDSDVTVIDFYYQYQKLGITAMHEYYRTDGNAEASTAIVGADGNAQENQFNVSYDKLYGYQFEGGSKPAIVDGDAQKTLATAHFTENFKYQYFVNTTTTKNDKGEDVAIMAPKTYATSSANAFYYKPIEVAGGTESAANPATLMPISYIAMPAIYSLTEGTENSTHVTFANVGGTSVLKDGAYLDWGTTNNKSGDSTLHDSAWASATLKAVFENLTLTDGTETWSGALPVNDPMYITKNPYIEIKYIASIDLNDFGLTSGNSLINQFRANLTANGDYSYNNDWKDINGASKFREDRFGFSFTKKKRVDGDNQTGKRFAGSLKFTVNLKTNTEGAASQPVSVDIKLRNSEPTSFKFVGQSEAANVVQFSTVLTTAKTSGETFKLVYGDPGTNEIGYRDPDTTDEARFFMPSASNQSLGALKTSGGITEAELNHILLGLSERRSNYTNASTLTELEAFVPNPGYDKFFSISPTGGTSTSLQIVPKAKTALNIPKENRAAFLADNNLVEDSSGVYYPFRVLIYDDLDDTGFTNGFYMPVLIKVYINNEPLKFTGSLYGEGEHARAGKYEFTLVKGIDQSVDVSSFLTDNDMVMNGQSFAVKPADHDPSSGDKDVAKNQDLVKDYLEMPAAGDFTVLKGGVKDNLPIEVTNSADSSIITFTAKSAFKNAIDLLFKFKDSDPNVTNYVEVVIRVNYVNEKPSENADTFGGASTFNIVMKTNDFFTLHVADASTFDTDRIGLFKSPDAFDAHVTSYPANDHSDSNNDSAYMSAAQLRSKFKQYTTTTYPTSDSSVQPIINVGDGDLGDLVVGGDDAPSTLRFLTNATGKPVGSFSSGADLFDVSILDGSRLPTEEVLSGPNPTYNPNSDSPMSIRVTAKGVIDNVKYVVTMYDHAGVRKDVTFNITVLSTAPTLAVGTEHNFPNRLTVTHGTAEYRYSTTLRYGEEIDFALSSLVSDVDRGDSSRLVIPDAYDGAKFKIEHKSGVSAVTAESVTRVGVDYIRIKATDFIPVQGDDGYSKVTFRVADPHGVQSAEITIGVFVYPQDMTSSASTVGEKRTLTLDSYAKFAESGERTEYSLTASATSPTTLFVDPDYNSLSALYSVTVYALYDVDEKGAVRGITVSQLDFDNYFDSHIILRRVQAMGSQEAETTDGEGDVFDYVSKFFTMEISDDGRIITFTPVSATIPGDNNGRTVTPLNLYIRVAKSYTRTTASGSEYTLDPVGAYLDVSVANSTPVAVQNSAINYGYPQIEDGVARVSDFLSFTGSAGDELTWDLYNTDPERDENFGLFYDYDKINNPTGNESLTYNKFEVLSHYEYGSGEGKLVIDTARDAITPEIASSGPVLSVTETQGKVTIKINRKVRIAQPTTAAPALPYSYIPVEISCYDTLGARASAATRTVAKTVIIVRVQNDAPDFKTVADQDNRLGYRVSYNETTGEYDLTATVKTGDRLTLNYRDIIDDADFNMDAYFFSSKSSIKSDTTAIGNSEDDNLFSFTVGTPSNNSYGISTVSSISFTCVSNKRGEVARSTLILCDSTMQETATKLNIILTVGNTKPTLKSSDPITINLMGKTKNPPEGVDADEWNNDDKPAATFNILDFMTDINPDDAIDMDGYPDINAEGRPYTYMYIENIVVYTTESETNKPLLTGPAAISGNDKGEPYNQACVVSWSSREDEPTYNYSHQNFDIVLSPGLYGSQKVTLTVTDSGYLDGAMNYVDDGESEDITITIVISRPIEEIEAPTFDIANRVTRRITPELLLNTADEPHNADGYAITSITTPENSPIEIIETPAAQTSENGVSTSAAGSAWAIRAKYKQADATITVVFNGDPEHNSKTFNINILDNNAPIMRDIENMGIFSTAELNEKFMITITPERWFTDPDVEDVMSYKSATVKVSAYAEAHLDGRNIVLLFKGRGTTDLTLEIQDLSGNVYNHTIKIGCSDMAQLSAWNAIVASIQSNVLMYAIIAGGVLLLIILLIIILVVVHKKRKMRREIEALLDSEAELEEEMLRLSSAGMSPYQSYGYLPPTTPTMNDPGLMLGSAQGNPTPNSLQLGAGTGQTTGAAPTPPVPPTQPVTQNIPVTGAPQQQPPQNGDGFDPNSF